MLSLNSRLSLATLLLLSSSGFADEAYTIAIHRPDKVGQKYRVQASGDFKRVIENYSGDDRRPPLMIAYRVDIAAESEVLAVGPAGEAVKIRFTIARLNRLVDRRSTPVLEKDATVTAELVDKKVRYAVNDKSADSDVAEALSLVLDGLFDSAKEEKTFAPGAPKKPGDDWPVNSEAAASDLRSAGLAVRPEDIKGKVKLKEIADVEKVRCLVLSADYVAAVARPRTLSPALALRHEPHHLWPRRTLHLNCKRPDRRDEVREVVAVGHGEVRPVEEVEAQLPVRRPPKRDVHEGRAFDRNRGLREKLLDERPVSMTASIASPPFKNFAISDSRLGTRPVRST